MAIFQTQIQGGGGSAPAHYIEKTVDANGKLVNGSTAIDLTGVIDVGNYALFYAYYNNSNLTGSVDLSPLTTVSGAYAFQYAFSGTGITSADVSSLTTVNGDLSMEHCFSNCASLVSANLSSLTTIMGRYGCASMFQGSGLTGNFDLKSLVTIKADQGCQSMFYNTGITSIDLGSLTTIDYNYSCENMFYGTNLTNVYFYSLTSVLGSYCCVQMFNACTSLTNIYYPSLRAGSFSSRINQFGGLVKDVTGCTIHFPANLDPQGGSTVISSLTGYPDFGGTNTVLAFDLPSTFTLTGADAVTYTRNPKYDTATALAWKVGTYGTTNFTPAYYTSGTTDPQVNDTIYSDSACTTAVTTISAIA